MPQLVEPIATDSKSDRQKEADNDLVISYLTLRNLIGISGMLLPLILILATSRSDTDARVQKTISDYYYTSSGELFVVILSMLAVFLFTYRGYSRGDKIWTFLAGIGAMGVAFFPTSSSSCNPITFSIHASRCRVPRLLDMVEWHLLFAALFFVAIAIVSIFYFTRKEPGAATETAEGKKTPKGIRNMIYRVCGWTIIACIIGISIYFSSVSVRNALSSITRLPVVFTLETLAIEAFGVAWVTKGETLWPDGEGYWARLFR